MRKYDCMKKEEGICLADGTREEEGLINKLTRSINQYSVKYLRLTQPPRTAAIHATRIYYAKRDLRQ